MRKKKQQFENTVHRFVKPDASNRCRSESASAESQPLSRHFPAPSALSFLLSPLRAISLLYHDKSCLFFDRSTPRLVRSDHSRSAKVGRAPLVGLTVYRSRLILWFKHDVGTTESCGLVRDLPSRLHLAVATTYPTRLCAAPEPISIGVSFFIFTAGTMPVESSQDVVAKEGKAKP